MKIEQFKMERMQSTWENIVEYNLSESGVHPLNLDGFLGPGELAEVQRLDLGYSQTNGTTGLKQEIARLPRDQPGPDPGDRRLLGIELHLDVEHDRARRRGCLRAAQLHADVGPAKGLRGEGQNLHLAGEPGLAARPG